MTKISVSRSVESPDATDHGKNLYQLGPQHGDGRLTCNSTTIQAYHPLPEVFYPLTHLSMPPLKPFEQWARVHQDYESHAALVEEVDIDAEEVPFGTDSIPPIVLEQFRAWMSIVSRVDRMLNSYRIWDRDIDKDHAVESLEVFRNLLLAPGGLKFKHLDGRGTTKLARLGPCAVVKELRAAVVGSKICAYYDFEPFDELQALLVIYKRLLRKTDANPSRKKTTAKMNKRRYDHSIDRQMPVLTAAIDELLRTQDALADQLDDIPDDWDQEIKKIHQSQNKNYNDLHLAREKAHWYDQMLHYIQARILETDTECASTSMQPGRSSDYDIDSSLQGLGIRDTGLRREPQRSLSLRNRPFSDDEEEDCDDNDTIVPDTEYTQSESQSQYAYSDTPSDEPLLGSQSEYTMSDVQSDDAHSESESEYIHSETESEQSVRPRRRVLRTFDPVWTLSFSDSEGESDSETDRETNRKRRA